MRGVTAAVMAVGMAWTWAGGWAANAMPPTTPFAYAVFGLGEVLLRDDVRAVGGDVGSTDGAVTVGRGVRVAGAVVGRTIKLRQDALADSPFCLLLEGGPPPHARPSRCRW